MRHKEVLVSLEGFTQQDIDDIKAEAGHRRCSFETAMKQMALERIHVMRRRPLSAAIAKLFRFPTVH